MGDTLDFLDRASEKLSQIKKTALRRWPADGGYWSEPDGGEPLEKLLVEWAELQGQVNSKLLDDIERLKNQ